ncbi:hypothetical protein [Rhodospirillum sp. A1_3_36]|uniref:hypothetical protein n=1 Tax=Rhodospirillum sp. A1_3_36 TaxID=3391666 RepID=UPI0039A4368E
MNNGKQEAQIFSSKVDDHFYWKGIHKPLYHQIREHGKGAAAKQVAAEMEIVDKRKMSYGPPIIINKEYTNYIRRFCAAYHRLIEEVMKNYVRNEDIQKILTIPKELKRFSLQNIGDIDYKITYCRPDLLPVDGGHFYVLETNADCPGGPMAAGIHNRLWRKVLSEVSLPTPMPLEEPTWFADWMIKLRREWSDEEFETFALFSTDYRYELDEMRNSLERRGINVIEIDPRKLETDSDQNVLADGKRVDFGYQKFDIPDCCQMYQDLTVFFDAISNKKMFVQNGMLAKLVGDNKLCLAVLTDSRFSHLFDKDDLELVEPHLIWTRNISLCDQKTINEILGEKDRYVLKKPIEAQGKGVIIGKDIKKNEEWSNLVSSATDMGWLVTEYREPASIHHQFDTDSVCYHDLCTFLIDGQLVGADARSSPNRRMNVALGGSIHAAFFEDETA